MRYHGLVAVLLALTNRIYMVLASIIVHTKHSSILTKILDQLLQHFCCVLAQVLLLRSFMLQLLARSTGHEHRNQATNEVP